MEEKYLRYRTDFTEDSTWNVISPILDTSQINIYLQEVCDFHNRGELFTEREGLESFCIMVMLEGEVEVWFREGKYEAQPHDLIWVDCREKYRITGSSDTHYLLIHFWGEKIQYYFEQLYSSNNRSPLVHLNESALVETRMRNLLQIYKNGNSIEADFMAAQETLALITELILHVLPRATKLNGYVQKTINHLETRFTEKLTMDDIAHEASISKFHLTRIFKQAIGITPIEYLMKYRIVKAKELLRQTDMSIEEISEKIGIDNQSYLIRLFKKYEGISPGKFRKSWL